jgi:hypothetical protein
MVTAGSEYNQLHQDVTDITKPAQLLRYATAGQLALLQRQQGLTQGKLAQGAGLGTTVKNAGPALTVALRSGPTLKQLQGLDEVIAALAPDLAVTGGLSSLALRLSTERGEKTAEAVLAARIPTSWSRAIISDSPVGEVGVLMQASALLSELMTGERIGIPGAIASIRDRRSKEIELLVRRLILIAVGPPTPNNFSAQIMLGRLASYAFETMRDQLESQLRHSPMSFRVWRTITKLVRAREGDQQAEMLKPWVRGLIVDAEGLRKVSLYAGRGLDLDLAITVPLDWSPPDDDWVGDALLVRARDPEATIRERGTAGLGLWQRALERGGPRLSRTEADLRALITEFRNPESRPDASAGLRWLAATLEQALGEKQVATNTWPDVDEPWFRNVQRAASELDQAGIPPHLLTGTKNLFMHMILQNAGVYRQQAIETVVASGWNTQVGRVLGNLLKTERDEAWLRVRVEFALGHLQRPDMWTETALTGACELAYENLKLDELPKDTPPPRSRVTEMHASLFAVGDCFGVAGAEESAKRARERLRPILEHLVDIKELPRARMLRRATRAAAYLLTVTAQPQVNGRIDLSEELLEKLSSHPDPITRRLSRWALSFRFNHDDGTVRPFLASAEHGENVDAPY